MSEQFFVEIVETATDKVHRRLGPNSQARAEKVDGGVNINLDHEQYYTRIVSAGAGAPPDTKRYLANCQASVMCGWHGYRMLENMKRHCPQCGSAVRLGTTRWRNS